MKKLFILSPGRETTVPERWTAGPGESLSVCIIVLPGVSADLPLTVDLTGEGADVRLAGVYACGGAEQVRFTVRMNHHSAHTTSKQLFNGIAGGTARAEFYGKVTVDPDAQQIEAYQENHNVLLSESATVQTRPQLEIYADDVKCSHGATIGRLDEGERFYMQSRGIPEKEAKTLQMISFLSPVLEYVEDSEREEVAALLEEAVRQLA